MNRLLNFASVALSVISLLSAIWIVLPAPFSFVWLLAVAASEWSLYLALLALVGIVCGLLAHFVYHQNNFWFLRLLFGIIAFAISLYPFVSVLPTAREQKVSLSFARYFAGLKSFSAASPRPAATRAFAKTGNGELLTDVYLPTAKNDNNGASVIVVHGGSWSRGVRNDFPQWNEWLAAEGYTIFDVDYRLAPQPNYLSATGDVKCAVKWVKQHAAEFNISPDRIALFGRSAGGQLALLAAYSAGDKNLPAAGETNETSEAVRAVVGFYAPTDLLWAYDHPANQRVLDGPRTLSDYLGGNPHDSQAITDRYNLASPAAHVSAETPPTFLAHGGQDQLVRTENMQILDDKLNENGVAHQIIYLPYGQHGFDYNFNGWSSQIIQPPMLDFLRENTRTRDY